MYVDGLTQTRNVDRWSVRPVLEMDSLCRMAGGIWHGGSVNDDDYNDDCRSNHRPCRGTSVALTRNYVNASNLPDVLRFLDTRVGQISGCWDRIREGAVALEDLGREFRWGGGAMTEKEEEDVSDEEEMLYRERTAFNCR